MSGDLPAPIVNADCAPCWDAARDNRLVLRKFRVCGGLRSFPRFPCTECGSERVASGEASGRGTVHGFTIIPMVEMKDPGLSEQSEGGDIFARGHKGGRQVRRHDVALVHNDGGILSSNCTMILSREAR